MPRHPYAHTLGRKHERHIPVAVGSEHPRSRRLHHPDDLRRRVAEAVPRTNADHGDFGIPGRRTLGGEPVRAAVVRKLQHIDIVEHACLCHATLCSLLDIPGQDHLLVSDAHVQHNAGVIRSQLLGLRCRVLDRPKYSRHSRADAEGVRRAE